MTNKFLHQKSLSGTPNWGSAQVNASRMAVSNQYIGSFLPLKFFATFLVLFAFGIGSVWGTDEVIYTLDGTTTGGSSGYATASDITQNSKSWKVTGNTTMNPWRIGGGSLSNVDRTIYSTGTFSEDITKVVLTHGAASSITVNSVKLIVSTNSNGGGTQISEISKNFTANSTITFNRPNNTDWSGRYFKIIYNVTVSGSNNKFVEFKKAEFYAESAVAHTVTLKDDNSSLPEASAGAGVTLPSRSSCTGYTFAGWTASWTAAQTAWTTIAPTIIPAGSYKPSADVNLYPVYTKTEGGSGFTLSLTYNNTEYYISPRSGSNTYFGVTTNANNAETFYIEDDALYIYENSTKTYVSAADNNSSVDFSTSDPTGWTITNSSNVWTFQSKGTGTRHLAWNYNNGTPRFATYTGSNTYLYQYTKHTSSTTSYISVPNCCTPLAQINGSVNVTSARTGATVSWTKVANASGYEYKLGNGNWTDTGVSGSATNPSFNLTNLSAVTQYTIYLRAKGNGTTYCDGPSTSGTTFKTLSRVSAAENNDTYGTAKVSLTSGSGWADYIDAADGTTIYLQANPTSETYAFSTWSNPTSGSISSNQLTGWSGDVTVTANFALAELPKVSTPTGMSSSVALNSATVSWAAVAYATGYTVTCEKTSDQSTTGIVIGSITGESTKSCTITGLAAGTDYTWTVQAIGDGVNYKNSDACSPQTFKTLSITDISVKTAPKAAYLVGEQFDPTGLEITRTFSNSTTDTYTYANHTSEFTFSLATNAALTADDDEVSITWNGLSTAQSIKVYTVTINKIDVEEGNAIGNANVTVNCTGRTLSQSVGSTNYLFDSWEVTAGGVTISNNVITGTPNADVTINAKFHLPIAVEWKIGNGDATGGTREVKYGTAISALPTQPADNALASCGPNKFMGWSTSVIKETGTNTAPSDMFTAASGAQSLTANTTYHAVFATSSGSNTSTSISSYADGTYYLIDSIKLSGTSTFYSPTGTAAGKISSVELTNDVSVTDGVLTLDLTSASLVNAMKYILTTVGDSITIQNVSNSEYIGSAASGTNFTKTNDKKWKLSASDGRFQFLSSISGRLVLFQYSYDNGTSGSHNEKVSKQFGHYTTGNAGKKSTYEKYGSGSFFLVPAASSTYSNYMTGCCTPLATIDGAVTLTNDGCELGELKATWKSTNAGLAGVQSQTVKVYRADNNNEVTGLTGLTGKTASTTDQTVTISGLDNCTAYYVKIENESVGGDYCAGGWAGEKSASATTKGYTYSFTLTGDHVTKTAGTERTTVCDGDIEYTFEAVSGWALPSTISVTNAGTLNNGYTWNQATGALVIDASKVTGDVTVTITATEAPCEPLDAPVVSVSGLAYPYDAVTLSWSLIENADGYTVEIYEGETLLESDDLDGGAESYTITTTLVHSTAYSYKVRATSETPAVHCPSNWATAEFETLDYPYVHVTYSENGETDNDNTSAEPVNGRQLEHAFALPNSVSNECTKVFVGWTTATYSGDNEPAVFYAPGANFTIHDNQDITLYAVYATASGSTGATHTLTISGKGTNQTGYSSRSDKDNQNATWSGNYNYTNDTHIGLRKNNTISYLGSPVFSGNVISVKADITNGSGSNTRYAYLCSSNASNPSSGDLGSCSVAASSFDAELTFTLEDVEFNQFYLFVNDNLQFNNIEVVVAGDISYSAYATTCTGKVAKPVISGVTGGTTYESAQTITIETATPSATIHYTTDGSAPTTSSPTYSAQFELSANGDYTIRAIAVKSGMDNSDEATSVSFSIDKPFTSIEELIDANLATNTSGKKLVFTEESNAIITAVNSSNRYVQDASGKGIVIRSSNWNEAAVARKKIVGTITGTWDIYEGQMQLKDATFSDGMTFTPTEELPAAVTVSGNAATAFGEHPTVIVKLENMYFQEEALNNNYSVVIKDASENAYTIYDRFNSLAGKDLPLITTACDVTGILTRHIKNETTTYQIIPLETSAVSTKGALAVLPTISDAGGNEESPATVATGKKITITENANFDAVYAINDGAETAINGSAQVTISETASATKLFVKASRYFYTDATVTYYYIADENLTEHSITCATGLAGGSIQADKASAAKDAIITLTATPIDNYHFVEWSVTYNDGAEKTIDVENNQFSMPAYNVAVSATFAEDPYAMVSFVKGEDAATGTAPASQKVYVNQNATMPANPFTLDGHSFTGWKYDVTTLQADDTYKVTAEGTITFTAQWAANPVCTVTLHATGADDDVHEVIQGTVFNLPDAAEFSGYTFIGWATAPQTSETTEEITVVPTAFTPEVLATASTQDFYAVYTRTEGVARYERVTASQSNWSGDYLIAYSDDKFADGRTAGESGIGANGASVNPGENLSDNVVAASWGNTYKVTLEEISSGSNTYLLKTQDGKYNYKTDNSNGINNNANRSTAAGYPLTVTFNSSSNIAIANSAGAVFHYNTDASGYFRFYKNATMNPVYLYKYIGATTYYTTNPSVKYTVSYDLGAGAWRSGEGCDETLVEAGESYPICEDQPVLENKIFVKWQVNDADVVFPLTINANTTFEAVYRDAEPYAVNYSANGGVGNAPEATNVKEAADYTVLANSWFFRPGYVFEGWNTAADGSGATYAADATMIMPSEAVTLYAQWEQLSANEKEVVIVAKQGDNYFAMGQTLSSSQLNAISVAGVSNGKVIIPNNFSDENKTAVTWRMATNDNGATATFYSPANEKYLTLSSGGDLSFSNVAVEWNWNSEKQCYVIGSGTRTFLYRDGYNFKGYSTQNIGASGYADATYITTAFAKEIATADADESALSLGDNVVVKNGATLTVENQRFVNDVVVENGGTMATNAPVTVHDLIIHTTLGKGTGTTSSGNAPGACGQINNANNIAVTGDVFIQIELTQEPAASYGWYAFSVPFQVDALNGVYDKNGNKLTNEVGYAIMKYHGNVRANGEYAWKKYRDILQPGELYIITVADTDYKTLRFKKVAGADMEASSSVTLNKYASQTESTTDGGWNGIGNPNLQVSNYATGGTSPTGSYIQFLDHSANAFKNRQRNNVNLVVGSAFFFQYTGEEEQASVTINKGELGGDNNGYLAPAREPKAVEDVIYEVKIFNATTEAEEDNLFLTAREEATNTYEIGYDVAKMSMGTPKCAQISVPAYGTELCAADFPLVNNQAEYPLTITAPAAGTYRLETENYENTTIYLTKDGSIIWDLTMSPYEAQLTKGSNAGYGLKIVAAPKVTTDVEQPTSDSSLKGRATKVIIDEHVFILRGEQLFDVTGKAVK